MTHYRINFRFKIILVFLLLVIITGSFFIIKSMAFSKNSTDNPSVKAHTIKTLVNNKPNFKNPDHEDYKAEMKYAHHNNYTKPIVVAPATSPTQRNLKKKTAFLTFDDGPSTEVTPKIMAILNSYNIKATFFVLGKEIEKHPDIVKSEVSQGFAIANHTYSHDPDYDYADPKNLVADFNKNEGLLKTVVPSYNSKIVRFPGGSKLRPRPFIVAVKNAGYKFIDWNCMTRDAENPKYTVEDLYNNYMKTMHNDDSLIVLMHDSGAKQNTVQVLPRIIEDLKAKGYVFDTLKE